MATLTPRMEVVEERTDSLESILAAFMARTDEAMARNDGAIGRLERIIERREQEGAREREKSERDRKRWQSEPPRLRSSPASKEFGVRCQARACPYGLHSQVDREPLAEGRDAAARSSDGVLGVRGRSRLDQIGDHLSQLPELRLPQAARRGGA